LHTVDLSDPQSLVAFDGQEPACVLVQQPNYFGSLEDVERIAGFCKANKALFIVSADPTSLGLLEAPGHYGADIVVGDIQPLGNNLSFGGPYGGYMACKTPYVRQLPGRLIGRTVEAERENQPSRPCYTLTLQTREQHIRREKATSNICTNQALNVLKATVYMTLVGPVGLKQVATVSVQRAHYLAERLTAISGVTRMFADKPFFNEFVIKLPQPVDQVLRRLESQGILGGIALGAQYPELADCLLVTCTEMTTPEHIECYAQAMASAMQSSTTTQKAMVLS
jgi:glycine dehydrogenase subunit 1